MGNDNASRMHSVTGGSLPANVWKEVMAKAQEGLMAQPLPGTEMNADLAKKAAEAVGLGTPPSRNPFRRRQYSEVRKDTDAQPAKGRKTVR